MPTVFTDTPASIDPDGNATYVKSMKKYNMRCVSNTLAHYTTMYTNQSS